MTASQTGGKKGAWRAGRLFTRVGSTTMNTKRPFADDKPGTSLGPRPTAQGLCELLYPRSKRLHKRASLTRN